MWNNDGLPDEKVLGTYVDADDHLKQVHASLRKSVSGRGTSTARFWLLLFRTQAHPATNLVHKPTGKGRFARH